MLVTLGKQADVALDADDLVADQMMFLSVRDRPLAEVMRRLAASLDLEWRKSGPEDRLPRDPAAWDREKLAVEQRRSEQKWFREHLRRCLKSLDVPEGERKRKAEEWFDKTKGEIDPNDPFPVERTYLELNNRDVRLAVEVLSAWGDEEWGRLAREETITYRARPTAAQEPLPDRFLDGAREWQAETHAALQGPRAGRGVHSGMPPIAVVRRD